MNDGKPSIETFSLKSIGPEPTGATPIEEEDLRGLIPDFVATRADLNRVEFDNISKALTWAIQQASVLGPDRLLENGFLMKLHRQMFGDVWRWAGTNRRRITNIGSLPEVIISESRGPRGHEILARQRNLQERRARRSAPLSARYDSSVSKRKRTLYPLNRRHVSGQYRRAHVHLGIEIHRCGR
ncbi:MAG: hypothetical protein PXZ08_09640 [Actinomycetota bacterium]|nr:hypothetical protein [Actinomycetota bacterium]